jgi:hypothetical protein
MGHNPVFSDEGFFILKITASTNGDKRGNKQTKAWMEVQAGSRSDTVFPNSQNG